MDPAELERRVDASLRRLPPPAAPSTLLPRVMAAVDARARQPWYTRAWSTWPGAWRIASAIVLVIAAAAAGMALSPVVSDGVTFAWRVAGDLFASTRIGSRAEGLRATFGAVTTIWTHLVQPVSGWLLLAFGVMWAACAALGAALTRVAGGEGLHS